MDRSDRRSSISPADHLMPLSHTPETPPILSAMLTAGTDQVQLLTTNDRQTACKVFTRLMLHPFD